MVREVLDPHGGGVAIAMFLLAMPWVLLNAMIGSTLSGCQRFVRMLEYAVICLGAIVIVGYPLTASGVGSVWWLRLLALFALSVWMYISVCLELYSANLITLWRDVLHFFVTVLSLLLTNAICIAQAVVVAWRFPLIGLIAGAVLLLPYALFVFAGTMVFLSQLRRKT